MGRLLLFVVGLAIVASVAYFYVTGAGRTTRSAEPPQQSLQNVRESARNLEKEGFERAADIDQKTGNQ